jgi:hypothetical protein
MKPMTRRPRNLALLAVLAAVLLPAAGAHAQTYRTAAPPPLYPYAVPRSQTYAIEVAPNTYVIHRPAPSRAEASVRCVNCGHRRSIAVHHARRFDRSHKRVDRALVEELRKRSERKAAIEAKKEKENIVGDTGMKRTVFKTKKIVRDRPLVIVHKRYVDDPPRVIERPVVVDDTTRRNCDRGLMVHCDPAPAPVVSVPAPAPFVRIGGEAGKKRVINAEAEITILGPDRMNIRLFRRGHARGDKGLIGE